MQNQNSSKFMIKIIKIVSWTFLSIFVCIQFFLVFCVLFDWIDKNPFEIQITSITGFLILCLNVSMMIVYYRYAGMPYKSELHYFNLKHCGYVVGYWTFAFTLKFITAFIPRLSPGGFTAATVKGPSP